LRLKEQRKIEYDVEMTERNKLCKKLVIASPSVVSIEESVSTLNYARSANGVVNKPVATLSINVTKLSEKSKVELAKKEAITRELKETL